MRRIQCLMLLGLLAALTSQAQAGGIYMGGSAGLAYRPDTFLTSPSLGTERMVFAQGLAVGGFVGYDFGNRLRLETEIFYRENEIRTGGGNAPQAGTSSLMFNGYYDLPLTGSFDVYFGGGLGVGTAELTTISLGQNIDENKSVFAYQLETGVGWNFNSNFNLSLGYRFFDATDPEFELPTGARVRMELSNHEFIFKLRYRFDL